MDVTEPASADGALRRRLLGVGLGGAAVSLLPFLVGRASATTPNSGPTDSSATTTTSTPPKRPSDDDVTLLGFGQSVELAARNLYDVALGSDDFDDVTRAVMATIRESHDAYAAAISGTLGREAPQEVNPIFADLQSTFTGDVKGVLDAAYSLESTAVATHLDILGQLQGTDGASLIAAILIVEARHGAVLAYLNGATDLDALLVNEEADALAPAEG